MTYKGNESDLVTRIS